MREVFADTAYFAALLSSDDSLHELALLRAEDLSTDAGALLVTTDTVLIELLSLLGGQGEGARETAAALVESLLDNAAVMVEPQTRDRVREAVGLYAARLDKGWSGVDCLSMVVMEARGITEVLTHDHHFEQGGFVLLL